MSRTVGSGPGSPSQRTSETNDVTPALTGAEAHRLRLAVVDAQHRPVQDA